MNTAFTYLDWLVFAVYLIGTTILGVWLGRDQKDARDYFVASQRIPWWAVLISVVATETSALTFISIPGLAYIGDLGFLQIAMGYILGRIVIAYTLLPRYWKGQLVTAYGLLEQRFGPATRRSASLIFMATRIFGDSVRVFATAIPIALILGTAVPQEYVGRISILILGIFTVVYTWHGGMRAVVWTDVIQTAIYITGGIAAAVIIGQNVDGGWSALLSDAHAAGKLRTIDLYTGFDRPHTLFAGLLGGAFLSMASHGADQLIVQRLLATGNLRDAQRSLIGSGVVVFLQFALFLLIGVGLYAFYNGQPFARPDAIFPRFIIEVMPPGITGLVVAAILAAAMSTLSGALNSLAAASLHDIILPLRKVRSNSSGNGDGAALLRLSRLLTLVWSVVLIGGAMLYRDEGTPVVTIALAIASFTYGGLLGAFMLGIIVRRAKQHDALTGMAVGISVMTVIVFSRALSSAFPQLEPLLAPFTGIAWPWYVLIGTNLTFFTGLLSSFTHGGVNHTQKQT